MLGPALAAENSTGKTMFSDIPSLILWYSPDVDASRCCFERPVSLGNPMPTICVTIIAFRRSTEIALDT